jgi:AraC-like DNA-binding protein
MRSCSVSGAFLHRRCEETLALSDVAQAAGLSKARLCALFKTALGLAPIAYLEQIRMERAARLPLFTATDIETISQQLGYNERKYFDKRFKRR